MTASAAELLAPSICFSPPSCLVSTHSSFRPYLRHRLLTRHSGEVALVDARSGTTLSKLKQHSKYSTRCHWNASSTLAASTSQVTRDPHPARLALSVCLRHLVSHWCSRITLWRCMKRGPLLTRVQVKAKTCCAFGIAFLTLQIPRCPHPVLLGTFQCGRFILFKIG